MHKYLIITVIFLLIAVVLIFIFNKFDNLKNDKKKENSSQSNTNKVNDNSRSSINETCTKDNILTGTSYNIPIPEVKLKDYRNGRKGRHGRNSPQKSIRGNNNKEIDNNSNNQITISTAPKTKSTTSIKQPISHKVSRPQGVLTKDLTIKNGRLVLCALGKTPYYQCWEFENRLYYDFNHSLPHKNRVISNHSATIDPYCIREANSNIWDSATSIKTSKFGILDENLNIIEKLIIIVE
jgi:hypothetical protein